MSVCLHGFQHLFHGELVFCFLVLYFPNFPEAAFAYYVEVVEVIFLNFDILGQLNRILHKLASLLNQLVAVKRFFAFFFLLLVGKMLSIFKLESCFLLRIDHEVISQFMIEIIHI